MTDLIAAEFLKLRTTRTFWVLVGLALTFAALTTVSYMATSSPTDEDGARSLLSNVSVGALFMLILGVVNSAGEYRHGTITSTFLLAPDRGRVLVAKSLAHGLCAIAVAFASTALVLGIALPWLSANGESLASLGIGGSALIGILAAITAHLAITAIFGVAIGALLTNQIAAIVIVPVLLFVVDPIVVTLADGYGKFSISGIWTSLTAGSSSDAGYPILAAGPAALLYLAYAAVITLITVGVDQRRDVA